MMTLDECREHVGKPVVYRPPHGAGDEAGVISSVGDLWAYVRYSGAAYSKATDPALLELTGPRNGSQCPNCAGGLVRITGGQICPRCELELRDA